MLTKAFANRIVKSIATRALSISSSHPNSNNNNNNKSNSDSNTSMANNNNNSPLEAELYTLREQIYRRNVPMERVRLTNMAAEAKFTSQSKANQACFDVEEDEMLVEESNVFAG